MAEKQRVSRMIPVNAEMIKAEIRKSGRAISDFDEYFKYKPGGFGKRLSEGTLSREQIAHLAFLFQCPPDMLFAKRTEAEPTATGDPGNNVMVLNIANAVRDMKDYIEMLAEEVSEMRGLLGLVVDLMTAEGKSEAPKAKTDPERMLDLLEEKLNLGVGGRNIELKEFLRHVKKAGINAANARMIIRNAGYTIDKSGGVEWIMDERQ